MPASPSVIIVTLIVKRMLNPFFVREEIRTKKKRGEMVEHGSILLRLVNRPHTYVRVCVCLCVACAGECRRAEAAVCFEGGRYRVA